MVGLLECKQLSHKYFFKNWVLRVVLLEADRIYTRYPTPYTLTLLDIDFTAVTEFV